MPPPGVPLPVPSKAAIRALRGLVFGTTCTLALVGEDRRRRINTAHSAIRNARHIRSASRYNASGSALMMAIEEDAVLAERGAIVWKAAEPGGLPMEGQGPTRETSTMETSTLLSHVPPDADEAAPGDTPEANAQPARPGHEPSPGEPRTTRPGEADARCTADSFARTHTLHPFETAKTTKTPTAAELRERGKVARNQAATDRLLEHLHVSCSGPAKSTESTTEVLIPRDAYPFVRQLDDRIDKFMRALTGDAADVKVAAKDVLELLFSLADESAITDVLGAVMRQPGEHVAFLCWCVTRLEPLGLYKTAVALFLAHAPSSATADSTDTADWDVLARLCTAVVACVRGDFGNGADAVLTKILAARPAGFRLKTPWVTDLLYGHWTRTQSYAATADLFRRLSLSAGGQSLAEVVYHVDAAYRVMVQVALEAGERVAAESWRDQLAALQPERPADMRLHGLFALESAKQGDWAAVEAFFADAQQADKAADHVVVPILQLFLRTHSIVETESFVKTQLVDRGFALTRPMVTLMADAYGAQHDVPGFTAWLGYCAEAGFVGDAAFTNAVLRNCLKSWRYSFAGMRRVYAQLQATGPAFANDVTRRIMAHAALSGPRRRPPTVLARLYPFLPMRRPASTAPTSLHRGPRVYTSEHELYVAMKAAYVTGSAARAVRMYRRSVHRGMPPSDKCFSLAVAAALRSSRQNVAENLTLARRLHTRRLHVQTIKLGLETVRHKQALAKADQDDERERLRSRQTRLQARLAVAERELAALQAQTRLAAKTTTESPTTTDEVGAEFATAFELIRAAKAMGQDTHAAVERLSVAFVDAVRPASASALATDHERYKTALATAIKEVLVRLHADGIAITGLVLNRAAYRLYKAGHMRGACSLALAAADVDPALGGGGGRQGYNVWNYAILVAVYTRLGDAKGVRLATEGAVARGAIGDWTGFGVLKQAKRRLSSALYATQYRQDVASGTTVPPPRNAVLDAAQFGALPKSSASASAARTPADEARLRLTLHEVRHAMDASFAARQRQFETHAQLAPSLAKLVATGPAPNPGGGQPRSASEKKWAAELMDIFD